MDYMARSGALVPSSMSLDQKAIARVFETSIGRIRYLEDKAIRKLRHPARGRVLRMFVEDSTPKEVNPLPEGCRWLSRRSRYGADADGCWRLGFQLDKSSMSLRYWVTHRRNSDGDRAIREAKSGAFGA